MTRDRAQKWVTTLTPIATALLALFGAVWGMQGKSTARKASEDAAVAADAVVAISSDQTDLTDSLRLAFRQIAAVRSDVKLVKLASGGQRVREHSASAGQPGPSPPGLVSRAWRGITSLFGGG